MARLLGALGRLGGGEKKRPSSMQPLKAGETLEQKLDANKSGEVGPPAQRAGIATPKAAGQNGGKVFGTPLEELMTRYPGAKIPPVVSDLISYLRAHVDGIFRVPGENNELQRLKAAYDSGVPVDIEAATDVHGAASLLKHFFRDLPDPALTFAFYPTLVALQTNADADHRLEQTRRIITKSLPEHHRNLLEVLIEFLVQVADHSGENKMDISNLSKVFGPTLLRSEKDSMVQMLEDARYVLSIIRLLLEEFHYVFGRSSVPKGGAQHAATSESDAQIFPELKEDIKDRLQKKQPSLVRIQNDVPGGRTRSSSLSDAAPQQAAAAARLVAMPAPARSATPTPDKGRRKALNMKVEIPQGALTELLSSPELLLSPGRGPSNKDEMFAKLEEKEAQPVVISAASLRSPSPAPNRTVPPQPTSSPSPPTSPVSSPRLNPGPLLPKPALPASGTPPTTSQRSISPSPRSQGVGATGSERSNDPRLTQLVAAMTARLVAERAEDRRPSKVEDMNEAQLKAEEAALKRELAGYDKAFSEMFSEPPKREDRFPLKPLAERYKVVLKALGLPGPSRWPAPQPTNAAATATGALKSSAGANAALPAYLANNAQYNMLLQRKREAKLAIDSMQKEFEVKHGGRRPETNEEKLPFAPLLKAYLDVKAEMSQLEETLKKQT